MKGESQNTQFCHSRKSPVTTRKLEVNKRTKNKQGKKDRNYKPILSLGCLNG